jgi:hypothetical protein
MKLNLITTIVALMPALTFATESEERLQQAVTQSSDIIVARVLQTSPVGHGSNSVTVSFQIDTIRSLKGTNYFSGAWVTYTIQSRKPHLGSDYETSIRKDEQVIFVIANERLLRAENLERESTIKNMIREETRGIQQTGCRHGRDRAWVNNRTSLSWPA